MHLILQHLIVVILAFMSPCFRCQQPVVDLKTSEERARDALPRVICTSRRIRAIFGPLVRNNLLVKDSAGINVQVHKTKENCGVRRGNDKNGTISFFSRYDSCYAQIKDDQVMVSLGVQLTTDEQWYRVNISCPPPKKKALKPTIPPMWNTAGPFTKERLGSDLEGQCDTLRALRVACGPEAVSVEACLRTGCCYDALYSTCYYRMNACSLDGHFVFWVKASEFDPPFNPSNLVVKDQPQCSPVVTTADAAVFKVRVTDCGTKMKLKGNLIIYEVEVEELLTERSAKHSQFSLQVQCQYEASDGQQNKGLRSLNPTNPPPVTALGSIHVQMRIATDESFTSFLPPDQLPLTLSLKMPVYVEVSLAAPFNNLGLSLRVSDCFAYPSSRYSVWTLLYDGCPNPLDDMRSSFLESSVGEITSHTGVRRFDVKTFAFLDPETGQSSLEEMYFYCWVEICTQDIECAQRCTISTSEGERQKRESESPQAQLISCGPLLFGENTAGQWEHSRALISAVFVTCSSILFLLLVSAGWEMRRHVSARGQRCITTDNDDPSQQAQPTK